MNRRGLLATLHCAKRDLGLDDGAYRAVLERVAGKLSAKDLTDAELVRVVEQFRARGWQGGMKPKPSSSGHVRKVWALWGDLCRRGAVRTPTRAALRAFVKRLTGVSDPDWLTPAQANTVIESLKTWKNRTEAQS